MRTSDCLWLGLLLLSSSLFGGCGRHFTLEPGLWTLNADGRTYNKVRQQTSERFALIDSYPVNVVLNWEGGQETIEIHYAGDDEKTKKTAKTISGFIKEDDTKPGRFLLEALGRDPKYEFQLSGEVDDPRNVHGEIYGIEPIYREDGIQGKFWLKKASPQDKSEK